MPAAPREILLIDDSADDRRLFIAAVRATGLEVIVSEAADAVEAVMRLNAAGGRLPDLAVLDLGLVGLQGTTLLQVLRNAYGPKQLPIVVLTGSTDPADREICEAWNILDFFAKPQSQQQLRSLVESLGRLLEAIAAGDLPGSGPAEGSSSAERYAVNRARPPRTRST